MLFPEQDVDTIYLSRHDEKEVLGVVSRQSFQLDGAIWPSIEHYFHAMKFAETDKAYSEKIRQADTPKQARKLGRKNKAKLRKDWSAVKVIVMTRAVYTSAKTYPDTIGKTILETGDSKIMESSQYDYFWGCGRDRRGENNYGKVLMDVRKKLNEEALAEG